MNAGRLFWRWTAVALLLVTHASQLFAQPRSGADPLVLVVMDPLSRELACACVKGYGQRDYRKLAARLETALKQPVSIEFSDDLAETVKLLGKQREYLIVGDRSLVEHAANESGIRCEPIAELTDQEGQTGHSASFVVRSDDPARKLEDLAGRNLLVGLPEADQKYAATLASLKKAGITPPKAEKHLAFSDAALDLLDSEAKPLPVALLPSYALVMLQGCGSIKPGNLRVIDKTEPVPFIALFASKNIAPEKRARIDSALAEINNDKQLLASLETRDGFKLTTKRRTEIDAPWPDWRGPHRDGRVARLPARLPAGPKLLWKKGAVLGALAGLSVSDGRVLSAERDLVDQHDVYRCLDARDGQLLWRAQFPARGTLDYGPAPRAAPVIRNGRAYLLGAFGDLRCLSLSDGMLLWERHLVRDFGAKLPTWGTCSPPLILGGLLVVNPGAPEASLAALDLETGATRWKTPGSPAAYSAFVHAKLGGREQIVGYDERSLGGWDPATGKRLWKLVPPAQGDFNVPTPILSGNSLILSTENNGTRLYNFDSAGQILPTPAAAFADLAPDTATPVATCGRLFGVTHDQLFCLDLAKGLKLVWQRTEPNLAGHASFFADDRRVLVATLSGELILLNATADRDPVISRLKLLDDDAEIYAHPALVGSRLYARGNESIVCVDLNAEET